MSTIANLRKPKIFGLAVFDLVVAVIGMIAIFLAMWHWHFPKLNPWHFVIAAVLLTIPVGIVIHIIFGVDTALNSRLGLSEAPKSP
jgi:hypothetical protein